MNVRELKKNQLYELAQHRERLRISPHLRWLFFEITSRCNLNCRHCGSKCTTAGQSLTVDDMERTLKSIHTDKPMICLTGGEPMLHPDFFRIAESVQKMGFLWGMTTNATLIDEETAVRLKTVGMGTVSVSLDGMEESHDAIRGNRGSWRCAVEGLKALQKAGFDPQVTTVLNTENFNELESLYSFLCKIGIKYWRPINTEPIGRACESNDLFLAPDQLAHLLSFIRNKRFDQECKMTVEFGCSHYLGIDYERMVRDHYFLCGAGILIASVRSNGDICACLDVEDREDLVQGNVRRDDFMDVWMNRFRVFRSDRTSASSKCTDCSERWICGGDSTHTWDYEQNEPRLCYQDYKNYMLDICQSERCVNGIRMGL